MTDNYLKVCTESHQSYYSCARCNHIYCMTCERSSTTDLVMVKTIVRYCDNWRCQRERALEEGTADRKLARTVNRLVFESRQSWRLPFDVWTSAELTVNVAALTNFLYGLCVAAVLSGARLDRRHPHDASDIADAERCIADNLYDDDLPIHDAACQLLAIARRLSS